MWTEQRLSIHARQLLNVRDAESRRGLRIGCIRSGNRHDLQRRYVCGHLLSSTIGANDEGKLSIRHRRRKDEVYWHVVSTGQNVYIQVRVDDLSLGFE